MTKVKLYEKKIKDGRKSLYLDFYPPIPKLGTNKTTRREILGLYVYERPKNEAQREYNKETRMLAENIRAQRQIEVQSANYNFGSQQSKNKDFVAYFKQVVESKKQNGSKSTHENWLSVYKYLERFTGGFCKVADVNEQFCENFRDFLLNQESLSKNSAASYFDKFKAAIRDAAKGKFLPVNFAEEVKSIRPDETQREFLNYEELLQLVATPYHKYEAMRRAAIFSALTGMPFAEIQKFIWSEVQHSEGTGYYIRYVRKKTGRPDTLPISDEAFELLGERSHDTVKVFPELNYYNVCYHLPKWIEDSGIKRHITFHAFRHTYATLLLTLGEDLYTVSKMLGHKNIQTTQIYARVIDERKRKAANKITLKQKNQNK